VELTDRDGTVHAEIEKIVHIRRRERNGAATTTGT
jgi:hypothetical protein